MGDEPDSELPRILRHMRLLRSGFQPFELPGHPIRLEPQIVVGSCRRSFQHRVANRLETLLELKPRTFTSQDQQRPVKQFGQQVRLPVGPLARPNRNDVGGRQREEHPQGLGTADLVTEFDDHPRFGNVPPGGQLLHHQVTVNQEDHPIGVRFIESQPPGGVQREPLSHLAVILVEPLAQVVQQQGQVQQILASDRPVSRPHRSPIIDQRLGRFDRSERVFVDSEAVVLVELHQAASVCDGRHQVVEHPGVEHLPQGGPHAARVTKDRQETGTGLDGDLRIPALHGLGDSILQFQRWLTPVDRDSFEQGESRFE